MRITLLAVIFCLVGITSCQYKYGFRQKVKVTNKTVVLNTSKTNSTLIIPNSILLPQLRVGLRPKKPEALAISQVSKIKINTFNNCSHNKEQLMSKNKLGLPEEPKPAMKPYNKWLFIAGALFLVAGPILVFNAIYIGILLALVGAILMLCNFKIRLENNPSTELDKSKDWMAITGPIFVLLGLLYVELLGVGSVFFISFGVLFSILGWKSEQRKFLKICLFILLVLLILSICFVTFFKYFEAANSNP